MVLRKGRRVADKSQRSKDKMKKKKKLVRTPNGEVNGGL
jgi:hypothetical protein